MGIHQKSATIDIAQVKEQSKLEGDFLAKKKARDAELAKIIKGEDDRILLVIGPCSSDNEDAVLEYAHRLAKIQEEVKDKIFIVMRVYTAKPRTNGDGYKGLMHQPDTSKLPDLINGVAAVRHLHYRVITETGLTTADEMLYPDNLTLVDDLLSYHAIGARSVEDQEHRFVASGIDAPAGMKNPTSGNLNVMFNGIYAAQNKQNFFTAIYPNPFSNDLYIKFNSVKAGKFKINLTDIAGKQLIYIETKEDVGLLEKRINTSGIAKGVYNLSVEIDGEVYTQKVIKE